MAELYEVELSYSIAIKMRNGGMVDSLFLTKKGTDTLLYEEVQEERLSEDHYDEVQDCILKHGFDVVDENLFSARDENDRLPDEETLRTYLKDIQEDMLKIGFKITFDAKTEKFVNGGPIPDYSERDDKDRER